MQYKIVWDGPVTTFDDRIHDIIPAFEARGYAYLGPEPGTHLRDELKGAPRFKGLVGPTYDEVKGEPCIRYETPEMYEILSR